MDTLHKGSVGLAKAIYEYQKSGYHVSVPLVDSKHYDLVVEKDGKFYSVQCKTTTMKARLKDGKSDNRYEVGLRSIKTNTTETVTRKRADGDYDYLFVMCDNGDCYSIPSSQLPKSGMTVGGEKYKDFKIS